VDAVFKSAGEKAMLTFFSIPKPFRGNISRLQRNAIRSWRRLDPKVEILLLGDDPGVAKMAREVRAIHVPDVDRNRWGTPRVDDIFRKGEQKASNNLLCYINADIILLPGFLDSIHPIFGLAKPFLLIGQRWDLEVKEEIDFADSCWDEKIRDAVHARGVLHSPAGIDYFIFSRGLLPYIPPFGIGRPVWDNWFVLEARRSGAMVVDATNLVLAIHQTHDYSHHPQGAYGVWAGPEAIENRRLAGRPEYFFTVEDTTHILTQDGIHLDVRPEKIKRHFSTLMVLWPVSAPLIKSVRWVYKSAVGMCARVFHRKKKVVEPFP
jgi:hypothetical protein